MISKLLAMIGTLSLLALAGTAGFWAVEVSGKQPNLPDLEVVEQGAQNVSGQSEKPSTRRQRPEVFYAAVTERPLFAPSRRPVVEQIIAEPVVVEEIPEEPGAPPPPPAPELTLLGVIGTGDENRALVSNAGAEPVWVTEGIEISGWAVDTVGADWLDLTFESETIRIEMYQQ